MILSGNSIGQQAEWIERFNEVYISGTAPAERKRKSQPDAALGVGAIPVTEGSINGELSRPLCLSGAVDDDEKGAAMLEGKR
ncbi:hypothetical protein SJ05684_b56110 (plasmid) [Sinorhizobium sojae CCBAU 05684]|uniref:Uncharacterized protein n=1 Tax=Sinorhizobium sojae CCBAU 05684 TaxID=716928 RepID=A0A249PKY7_9HYPH|nr:hypothetical protein [Sinorhizobium sojae]ASY66593.1 hypothetical protein SJ05684_b56110 [Sinorhizobium sojae CCBAU 05684]